MNKVAAILPTILGNSYQRRLIQLIGSSLIQYHPFNEPSGTTVFDRSGNSRNSSYVGTPVFGNAGIGDGLTAINFNAAGEVNAYSADLSAAFSGLTGTMAFWVKPNSVAVWTSQQAWCFMGNTTTMYSFARNNGDGSISGIHRCGATISTNTSMAPTTARWVHIAFTWDKPNDKVALFVNGTKNRPSTGLGTWTNALAASYARYGDHTPAAANIPWNGQMAHAILANTVLSDSVIFQLAQSPGQVVFTGDSRTLVKPWSNSALEQAFPSGNFVFGKYGYASYSNSGWSLLSLAADGTNVDAILSPGLNTVVIWAGINDAIASADATTVYNRIKALVADRRASGWDKIIVCTEIDARNAGANAVNWHTVVMPALNTALRNDHSFADGLIDLGGDVRLQDATNLTYFNADALHPSTTGYGVVAEVAAPVIASVIQGS